ncbi:MAG: C4-type zinc ribbon domain-containing protein [Deferrisomatales bacterium]
MGEDTLGLLEKLQHVADEIDRLEARRREATEEMERIQENLTQAEQSLSEKQERARAIDLERRKRELALKSERERLARVKNRLGDVKTSREYQAVLSETSSAKQAISEHEEALAKGVQELEQAEAELAALKARIDGIREDRDQAAQRLDEVLAETEGAIGENKNEEEALLRSLPIEVVDRYRLIRSRRGGLAVVEARDEACTACFMRIPPQMYIEVIRRSRVIQCPNCHRILIPPKESPEE